MSTANNTMFMDKTSVERTGATEVEYCVCHCPVVVAPGAMERHRQRCPRRPRMAAPVLPIPVGVWAREWRP